MVESSGQANFTELDGGEQDVFGKATAVQVLGGTQVIESGGIASENTVLGGREIVSAGGSDVGALVRRYGRAKQNDKQLRDRPGNSGSLAIFAAIRRASSFVSSSLI